MPLAKVQTRFNKKGWGNIIGGILEANGEPDFMIHADDAASEMDETRREFRGAGHGAREAPRRDLVVSLS